MQSAGSGFDKPLNSYFKKRVEYGTVPYVISTMPNRTNFKLFSNAIRKI
jgi:hypothetical protein